MFSFSLAYILYLFGIALSELLSLFPQHLIGSQTIASAPGKKAGVTKRSATLMYGGWDGFLRCWPPGEEGGFACVCWGAAGLKRGQKSVQTDFSPDCQQLNLRDWWHAGTGPRIRLHEPHCTGSLSVRDYIDFTAG